MPKAAKAPVATLLRDAILEQFGSVRGYARYLAGDDPTLEDIERERRAINKHLGKNAQQPEVERAEMYARDLGKPADYFVRPISRESKRIRELEAEVARLQAELDVERRASRR